MKFLSGLSLILLVLFSIHFLHLSFVDDRLALIMSGLSRLLCYLCLGVLISRLRPNKFFFAFVIGAVIFFLDEVIGKLIYYYVVDLMFKGNNISYLGVLEVHFETFLYLVVFVSLLVAVFAKIAARFKTSQ